MWAAFVLLRVGDQCGLSVRAGRSQADAGEVSVRRHGGKDAPIWALPSKRAASGAIVRSAEVEDEMIYVVSGEVEATIGSAASRAAAGAVLIRSRDATRVGDRRTRPVTVEAVTPGASFEAFFEQLAQTPGGAS